MSNPYRPSSRIYHKYNSKSLVASTSSTNILSLTQSSPYSDQNDEIWIEFLNSLNQQTPEILSSDLNKEPLSVCSSRLDETGQVVDIDDAQEDDPDFTVCLENCDFDDPDYDMDKWFQIPKKEAVELVKDAIEICDGAPIVYDDQRHSKIKSANTIKKISELKSRINHQQQFSKTSKPNETLKQNEQQQPQQEQHEEQSIEFIPEITHCQKKQLDEQLRNHVQLLTQTCLVSYCSKEYKHVFTEAFSLLNVLKSLNEKDDNNQILPLRNFEIINLNESLDIVDNIQTMSQQELQFDQRQGIPNKFLEIIIKSPVFYNTNLVPNLSKFKYQSHFKRAQFTDTEKILLIMGFNKFKHLPKSECCECIKEHLLPNRCCDDIRKQLNYLSNSEQRQIQLADLMRKQKKLMTNFMHNYEFIKEVHYKSPFEQADNVQLPSQYTIIIERIKLANLLKETRKNSKQDQQKKSDKKLNEIQVIEPPTPPSVSILSKEIQNIELNSNRNSNRNQFIRYNQIQKIRPQITKVFNPKRQRSPSPTTTLSPPQITIPEQHQEQSARPVIIEKENDTNSNEPENQTELRSPPRSPSPIVISSASNSPQKEIPQAPPTNTKINNNSIPIMTALSSSPIILPTNFIDLLTRPNILTNSNNILRPLTQAIPIVNQLNGKNFIQLPLQQQQQQLQTQPSPVYLPANFGGTILIQPTIHIHTNSKNLNLTKYCQIKPKQTGDHQTNTNNSKKKKV